MDQQIYANAAEMTKTGRGEVFLIFKTMIPEYNNDGEMKNNNTVAKTVVAMTDACFNSLVEMINESEAKKNDSKNQ